MKGKILLGLTAILMLTGAAVPVKAPLKIAPRTVPIFPTFAITIIRVAARYIILINGTSQSEIATRPFIPPKRTTAIKMIFGAL